MKKFFVLLVFVLPLLAAAQHISYIEFDTIQKQLTDDKALYKKLTTRFVKGDSSLTLSEMNVLYFGAVFQPGYNPYEEHKDAKNFWKLYNEENYEEALKVGEKMLEDNPMDFRTTFSVLICCSSLNKEKKRIQYAIRYQQLSDVLLNSGDGASAKTAFVVIRVSDEYEILSLLQVKYKSQALVKDCDVFTLVLPNQYDVSKLYFNVSKPLEFLSKQFEDKH